MIYRRWWIIHRIVLQAVLPVLRRLPYRVSVFLLGVMGRLDLIVVPHQTALYERGVAAGGGGPAGPAGSAAPGTRGRSAAAWPVRRTAGAPATSCSTGARTVGSRRYSR